MLPSIIGVVKIFEAYGHSPGFASEIAPIVRSFSTSCLKYWRFAKGIGRSLCLNGFEALVLIVCNTTEFRLKLVGDAAKASRFFVTTLTSCFPTGSGIDKVATQRSAYTF